MTAVSFFARNVGTADRVVRIVVGLGLLFIAFTGRGVWGYIGLIPLLTGVMATCPLYSMFGLSTCPAKR